VLACAETLFAVCLYWWIAIKWDTHWHLLSSIFIAPLLLLRSPPSIELGIKWFKTLEDLRSRSMPGLWVRIFTTVLGVVYAGAGFTLAMWWFGLPPTGVPGWALFAWAFLMGLSALGVAMAAYGAGVGVTGGVTANDSSVRWILVALGAGWVAAMVAAVKAGGWTAGWGTFAGTIASILIGTRFFKEDESGRGVGGVAFFFAVHITTGAVTAIWGMVCRTGATLRHLPQGVLQLAGNWRENNFQVDVSIPAEVIPGIRDHDSQLSLDGFLSEVFSDRARDDMEAAQKVAAPLLTIIYFFPAFLYRLNIKATCWFWWPLAYLLKPVPEIEDAEDQKHELTKAYRNPAELFPLLIGGGILIWVFHHYYNAAGNAQLQDPRAVWLPIRVFLGLEWGYIAPWHWALLCLELSGIAILWLGGEALSYHRDHWKRKPPANLRWKLPVLSFLSRVKLLSFLVFIGLGLGMCLVTFQEWQKYLPAPLLQRLENFYQTQGLREQERRNLRSRGD